ncbi:MAG: hypothetical protein IPK13_09080 [Deltaproteobacteria bacterium]|nr:hypothetical protein [Deltaproteobacteria bacterium]
MDTQRSSLGIEALLRAPIKGPPLTPDVHDAAQRMLGAPMSLEHLSRIFQPTFPGVRVFAVEVRLTPDAALEITLVGVDRSGHPVFTGARTLAEGRDGSLELHRGLDHVVDAYQTRNITIDLLDRELELLRCCDSGPAARLTTDAEGADRYAYALRGFVFADETDEGPPMHSVRALDPASDRHRLIEASKGVVESAARRQGLGRIAIEAAWEQFGSARTPWDLARVTLPSAQPLYAEGDDGEMGVGAMGREYLLSPEAPAWRGALYAKPRDAVTQRRGEDYRRRQTTRANQRLERELEDAVHDINGRVRSARLAAIRQLGMIGPTQLAPILKPFVDQEDRKIALAARQTLRTLAGVDLPDKILAFAESRDHEARRRGLAYRVLAEYYPARIRDRLTMIRVNPDARIQRGIIPAVVPEVGAAGLASFLAANPWPTNDTPARPGLLELRIELIERLARMTDPITLPALMAAFRAQPAPPPAEMLALSRALVAFRDPRAQRTLLEVAGRFERPAIP